MKQHIGTGEHESVRKRNEALTFISFRKTKPLVIVNREYFMSIAPRSEYSNLKWLLFTFTLHYQGASDYDTVNTYCSSGTWEVFAELGYIPTGFKMTERVAVYTALSQDASPIPY